MFKGKPLGVGFDYDIRFFDIWPPNNLHILPYFWLSLKGNVSIACIIVNMAEVSW
jgi:hypothetical protein